MNRVLIGDCRTVLRDLAQGGVKVQCVVTSPPYFGLRQYFANAVRIKGGLTAEKRAWVENQLREAGIHAHQ